MRTTKTRHPGIRRVDSKSDHFEIRFSIKDINGKHSQKVSRFHGTMDEAVQQRIKLLNEARSGFIGNNVTMNDLAKAYFEYAAGRLQPGTISSDRRRWQRMAKHIGEVQVKNVTVQHIDALGTKLLAEVVNGKSMLPQTYNRHRAVLSSMFRKAVSWKIVATNPVKESEAMKSVKKERRPVDPAEVVVAINYFTKNGYDAYADFIELSALLGCRRGELLGLQVGDYNPVTQSLTICRAAKVKDGGGVNVGPTKSYNVRTFRVDTRTIEVLQRRISRVKQAPESFLFSETGHHPWSPDRISLAFARMAKETGIGFTLHGLRRLNTTMRLRAGVNPRYIQYTNGWADGAVMMKHYTDWDETDATASFAAMETLVLDQVAVAEISNGDSSHKVTQGLKDRR